MLKANQIKPKSHSFSRYIRKVPGVQKFFVGALLVSSAGLANAQIAALPECTSALSMVGTISPDATGGQANYIYDHACKVEGTGPSNHTVATSVKLLLKSGASNSDVNTEAKALGKLDRLVVFVDGLGEKNPLAYLAAQDLVNELYDPNDASAEFAVLFVDQPADLTELGTVEDNAAALKNLLQLLQSLRGANAREIAVVGYSFGGLVARYALADMESNNVTHGVSTYVSYDAPHKGAHIPRSIQKIVPTLKEYPAAINGIKNNNDVSPLIRSMLVAAGAQVFNVAETLESSLEVSMDLSLDAPATKQLLIDHVSGSSEYLALQQTLDNIGLPQQTQNIAVTNGSIMGSGLPSWVLGSKGEFFHFNGKKGQNLNLESVQAVIEMYPTLPNQTNLYTTVAYSRTWKPIPALPWWNTATGGVPKTRTSPAGVKALDKVAGSGVVIGEALAEINTLMAAFSDQVVSSYVPPADTAFSFIPAFSALAIDTVDYNQPLIVNSSPFDSVYSNGDNNALLLNSSYLWHKNNNAGSAPVEVNQLHRTVAWQNALLQEIVAEMVFPAP